MVTALLTYRNAAVLEGPFSKYHFWFDVKPYTHSEDRNVALLKVKTIATHLKILLSRKDT